MGAVDGGPPAGGPDGPATGPDRGQLMSFLTEFNQASRQPPPPPPTRRRRGAAHRSDSSVADGDDDPLGAEPDHELPPAGPVEVWPPRPTGDPATDPVEAVRAPAGTGEDPPGDRPARRRLFRRDRR